MTLTAEEVLEALRSSAYWKSWRTNDIEVGNWFEDEAWYKLPQGIEVNGERLPITEVDRTGGMDEGTYASVVFQIGDQFFRKEGFYQSHYGYDWDGDFCEVFGREKTITVYEP